MCINISFPKSGSVIRGGDNHSLRLRRKRIGVHTNRQHLTPRPRCWRSWRNIALLSRPGEFHPEPLTEPAVTVSRRPARAAVRGSHLSSKYEGSSCCQLTQPRLGCPLPLLHGHYSRFITNTEQSAPARSIGTFCLAVFFPLEHFPFASSCRFPSSAQKPE